jgi:hypothetical protein
VGTGSNGFSGTTFFVVTNGLRSQLFALMSPGVPEYAAANSRRRDAILSLHSNPRRLTKLKVAELAKGFAYAPSFSDLRKNFSFSAPSGSLVSQVVRVVH